MKFIPLFLLRTYSVAVDICSKLSLNLYFVYGHHFHQMLDPDNNYWQDA